MVSFAMQKIFSLVRSYLLTVALTTASVLFRKLFPMPVSSTYFLLPPIKQNQGVCSYTEVFDPLGDFCVDVHMDLFSFFCRHHSVGKIPPVEDPVLYPVCTVGFLIKNQVPTGMRNYFGDFNSVNKYVCFYVKLSSSSYYP